MLQLRVPNLYSLKLGLPRTIDTHSGTYHGFFDCKLRKLIIVLTVFKAPPVTEVEVEHEEEEEEEKVAEKITKTHNIEIVDA